MDSDFFAEEFFNSGAIISKNRQELIIGWGKRQWGTAPQLKKSFPHFYFPDFFLQNSQPWFTYPYTKEITVSDFLKWLATLAPNPLPHLRWCHPNKKFYEEQFDYIQKLFAENILVKAVPFVYETSSAIMERPLFYHALKNALLYIQSYPAYLYGFWEKRKEGILGATPELLFELDFKNREHCKLYTVALAGTFWQSNRAKKTNKKLLHEHQCVIEGIKESLSPFGRIKINPLRLLQLPTLAHLLTEIEVDLHHLPQFMEIVRVLHPTPAIGAFPREKGLEWLMQYQTHLDRHRFGAPVGYLWEDQREAKCYVAIRNIQWTSEKILIAAGGGVVANSQLEQEWNEMISKVKSIQAIFQI